MNNKKGFLLLNYIINALTIIFMSLGIIHDYLIGTIFIFFIFTILRIKVRTYYFGTYKNWPTTSTIKTFLLMFFVSIYLKLCAEESLSITSKYALLIFIVALYTLILIIKYIKIREIE